MEFILVKLGDKSYNLLHIKEFVKYISYGNDTNLYLYSLIGVSIYF